MAYTNSTIHQLLIEFYARWIYIINKQFSTVLAFLMFYQRPGNISSTINLIPLSFGPCLENSMLFSCQYSIRIPALSITSHFLNSEISEKRFLKFFEIQFVNRNNPHTLFCFKHLAYRNIIIGHYMHPNVPNLRYNLVPF